MPNYPKFDILSKDHGSAPKLPTKRVVNDPGPAQWPRKPIGLGERRSRAVAPALSGTEAAIASGFDRVSSKPGGTAIGSLNWDSQIDQVFMDHGMAEFLGLKGAKCLGTLQDLIERILATDRDAILDQIRSCMLRGRDFSTLLTLRGVGGERPLACFGTAILADSGRPNWLLLTAHEPATEADGGADQVPESPIGMLAGDALVRASHDIRNSISAILGFSRLLTDEGEPGSDQRRYAETIGKNAGELMQIIDDVFAEAKRQAQPSCNPAFRLSELMSDLVEMFDIAQKNPAVELTFELTSDDVVISADRVKVRRILINLLDNALKFTEHGSVHLRGGFQASSRVAVGDAVFEVEDTGVGIATEDLRRIFEPYRQVPGSPVPNSGIGLGLPIAMDLARHLGGDIEVESRVGHGTRFRVRIPVIDEYPN